MKTTFNRLGPSLPICAPWQGLSVVKISERLSNVERLSECLNLTCELCRALILHTFRSRISRLFLGLGSWNFYWSFMRLLWIYGFNFSQIEQNLTDPCFPQNWLAVQGQGQVKGHLMTSNLICGPIWDCLGCVSNLVALRPNRADSRPACRLFSRANTTLTLW